MANIANSPNPTNDPSYLNYAQDLDRPQVNRSFAQSLEGVTGLLNAGIKAGVGMIGQAIEDETYRRVDAERAGQGVDLGTEAAAAGVPIGTTKGDPAASIFNDNPDSPVRRPDGFDRFEKRIGALKQLYDRGGLSETYYTGRLEAHVREMVSKYGTAWRPEIDAAMRRIAGVDPANALRKSLVADMDRAERARQAGANKDETFVRQNLEYLSAGTLQRWQQGKAPFAEVQREVADRQRDKAETAQAKAQLDLKKARGELEEKEVEQVAAKEINIFNRQRMTELVTESGGMAAVRKMINDNKPIDAKQAETLRHTFAALREKTRNDVRQRLNVPAYDSLKPDVKEKLVNDATRDIDDLEKALIDKDTGVLYRTATYLEAQRDADMRQFLDRSEWARKIRVLAGMDKNGTVLQTMLMDESTGAQAGVIQAGRTLSGMNLVTGEGTLDSNRAHTERETKNGSTTKVLNSPAVIRQELRDFKNLTILASKEKDPTMLKNLVKGGFGPDSQNFLRRFSKESRPEVLTTIASPEVTRAMLRLKDEDPASWNMYTKGVTDMFNSQARSVATDLKTVFGNYQDIVSLRYDDEAMRFVVEPKEVGGISGQDSPVHRQLGAATRARQDQVIRAAERMNAHLEIIKPIIEANGGDKAAVMRNVLNNIGIDPRNPVDKGFWDSIGQKLFGKEPDPEKNPYVFNDLARPGMKDEERDPPGLITLTGEEPTPDKVGNILRVIRRAEAGGTSSAYGRVFGTRNSYPLEQMTLSQVMKLQSQMRASGSPSTAVGAYQFLNRTLTRLQDELGLTGQEKFDAKLQDRLAIHLMRQRGYDDWQAGKITRKQFVDNLAKEWAGLPNTGGRSHYEGDGLNRATVKLRDLLSVLPQPEPVTPPNPSVARRQMEQDRASNPQ
jgi:muramidase (phage lysozyme)